jgi:hypothetical protein
MRKTVDEPSLKVPTFEKDPYSKPALRLAFALAVAEDIISENVMPFADVEKVGLEPIAAYVCGVCHETFEEKRSRDGHLPECLEKYKRGEVERPAQPSKGVKVVDFHGDFIWSALFRMEFKARTRAGDGHRLCRVYSKYQLLMYAGTHSTGMERAVLRMRKQTDVNGGTVSPAMAGSIMYDRMLNVHGFCDDVDLIQEQHNFPDKESLSKLRPGHTKAAAQEAYRRGKTRTRIRARQLESLRVLRATGKKRKSQRRKIISKAADLLMELDVFNPNSTEMYDTVVETRTFFLRPVIRANTKRLREKGDSVDKVDIEWNLHLRKRLATDKTFLQLALQQSIAGAAA